MRKITEAVAAALAGAALAVAPFASSQASARPAVKLPVVYSQVQGWHGGHVRPAAIFVGEGGAPWVIGLKWSSWTSASAQANGYLYMQKPGCALPSYECPYLRFRVSVALSRVETHARVRYYSRMQWAYIANRVRRVLRWVTYQGYWAGPGM